MKISGQNHQKVCIVTYLICVIQVHGDSLNITQYPQYPIVSTSATLTCHIPSFTGGAEWFRNGVYLASCFKGNCRPSSTPGYQLSVNATAMNVTISSINIALDETTWTCIHNTGDDTGYFNLTVYNPVGAVQVKNGTNFSLIESQSAVLVCETDACRPSAAIYWMKNGINITDSLTIGGSSDRVNSTGTLNYTGQRGDNGTSLACGAYNGLGSVKTSANLTITIYYPPSIEGLNSSYKVIENKLFNVTCLVTSNPPADWIFWSPRGEGLDNFTLYFSSVTRNNTGNYSCTAQNTMIPKAGTQQIGTNTSQIQVDVLYPPSIGLTNPYKVIENQTLNVTCVVTSNPPADRIFWSPNGEGLENSILYFQSVSRNISGNYSCTAQNTMRPTSGTQQNGKITNQMQVDVLYPPSIEGLTSPYKVIENQTLNVTCVVTCNPPADQIVWSPSGEVTVSSMLYFSSVTRNKNGMYTCTAQNTMKPSVGTQKNGTNTSQMQVDVLYPPSIQGLKSLYKVIENQPLNVTCEVNSNPPVDHISWSPRGESSVNSTLYFQSVSRTISGNYSCTAQNSMRPTSGTHQNGKITNEIQIDVLYPPSIERLNSSYKVIENQTLSVTCVATSNPTADRIFWSPRGEGSENSTLYFISVTRNKSGIYNCTAQNTMKPTDGEQQNGISTSQIVVDVQYGARISNLFVHGSNTINESSSVIFNCHVESNPPSTITWMKEENRTVLKNESRVVQSNYVQSNYTIKSAKCLDMGNYTCTANNGIWSTANGSLELFVTCHPRTDFRLNLTTKLYRKRHEAASLRYIVIAYPPPTFTWTFRGNGSETKVLNVSASHQNNGHQSELNITSLEITDFGNYSVIANNSLFPPAMVDFEIIQADFPDVPSNVTIIEITQTSVKVQWMAGYNGGPQQTFHIVASAGNSTQNNTEDDPGYQQTGTTVLISLLPGTNYSIYVVAINLIGPSNISQAINVTTLKEPDPPISEKSPLAAVAGGIGAGVGVILVVALVVFLVRRHRHHKPYNDEKIYENSPHVGTSSKEENEYEGLSGSSWENAYAILGASNASMVDKDSLLYVNLRLDPLTNKNFHPLNNRTEAVSTN